MRIVIINTHSLLNPGDSAIVLAQVRWLKERCPDVVLSVTSRTPELDREFYGPLGVQVFPTLLPAPSLYNGWRRKVGMSLRNLAGREARSRLREEIRKSDLVISSGGGYFFSYRKYLPGLTFRQNVAHVGLARRYGKPIVFFPQSFGPLRSRAAREAVRRSIAGENVVKVLAREKASFELVRGLLGPRSAAAKLDLCPDIAFLLSGPKNPARGPFPPDLPRPRMMVTLRPWDFPEARGRNEKKRRAEDYLATCAAVCRDFYRRSKGSVVVFPQVRGPGAFEDDRPVSKAFWEKLGGLIPDGHRSFLDAQRPFSPPEVLAAVSQVELMLATRTHAAIMALVSSVPVVLLSYQPKGTGTMELLGLERFSTRISEFDSRQGAGIIDEILSRPAALREELERRVAVARKTIGDKLAAALEAAD